MNFLKRIILLSVILPLMAVAQEKPKANWQNLDLQKDGVFGVSTEKAYDQLLKGKKAKTVVVAVIDGGVDAEHEDLKSVIWVNPEVKTTRSVKDTTGFVNDVHGWNFIGSDKGNVQYDNTELLRLIRYYKPKYASVVSSAHMNKEEKEEFALYEKLVTEYMNKLEEAGIGYENMTVLVNGLDSIVVSIGKESPSLKDFDAYKAKNEIESKVLQIVRMSMKEERDYKKFRDELDDAYQYYTTQVKYHLNMEFDPRDLVGDNEHPWKYYYGNPDVKGPDASHGTHVAGIIGADRKNTIGIKGVADHVQIMAIRAVPDGDERDKDVANAIRYAVDHGAKVINMSFGKSYSWDKELVDNAVKYAASKDVLLVHAAGNDSNNNDVTNNFPTRIFGNGSNPNFWGLNTRVAADSVVMLDTLKFSRPQAANWLEVGASSWKNDETLVGGFSNYGKHSVDVFAPGVKINSTIPDSKYKEYDGTSMASPVVAGVAALIRSYYPALTAVQVKDIIMKSVTKVNHKVKIKENDTTKHVDFTDICISGGIVNAYNALELAAQVSRN